MISARFLKSSFIYSVIGALPLASSLVLLPFYTYYLETSDFGQLAIYISFTLFIQIIVNYCLDTTIGIHYFEYRDQTAKLKSYISTIVLLLLAIGLAVIVLFSVVGDCLFHYLFSGKVISFFPFGLMSVVTAFFNSFFKTYSNLLINQQRPTRFFWVNSINFILTIAISLVGLYWYPHTLIGPMWGRLLSGVGIFLIALYCFFTEFGLHFQKGFLASIFSFSTPVLVYSLLMWVLSYIDRYIINYFMLPADLGVFDFALKCTLFIDFIQMGLGNSIMPKIYAIWKEKQLTASTPEVNRYHNSFMALSVLLIGSSVLMLTVLLPFVIFKHTYYQALNYLPIVAAGFVFRGLFNMYLAPIYFFKKTKVLPMVFFYAAIVQVVLSIVLIKYFGLWGAAWASFLSKLIQLAFIIPQSKKIFKFQFNSIKLIAMPTFFAGTLALLNLFTTDSNRVAMAIVDTMVAILLVALLFHKELLQLAKEFYPKLRIKS